jgi:hypothetical protein
MVIFLESGGSKKGMSYCLILPADWRVADRRKQELYIIKRKGTQTNTQAAHRFDTALTTDLGGSHRNWRQFEKNS